MCGTLSSEEEKEKGKAREDSDSADSDVDPMSSLKMTYGPTLVVVERDPAVALGRGMAGSKTQKEEMERP